MHIGTRRKQSFPLHEAGVEDTLEQRAVVALRALQADRAPHRLRLSVERLHRGTQRPRARRPLAIALPAGAIAAIAVAIALILPAGTPGGPSVGLAAQLALRGPVLRGPSVDPNAPASRLDVSVGSIEFPNWSRLGWHAAGWRSDRLKGRRAVTVFYANGNRSIAYTIIELPSLQWPPTSTTTYAQTRFAALDLRHRLVITWQRAGQTCILSGQGASSSELFALATWHSRVQDQPDLTSY